MNEELYMDQNKWLISVALNRRHLTEGQKAVLANEYRKILSEKRQSEAGKKAINARWHPDMEYDLENVSQSNKNEADPSCKEAFDKFRVSEWPRK